MINKSFTKIAYSLLLSLTLATIPGLGVMAADADAATASASDKEALSSMKKIAENEALELYYDEEETDIAVRVKETGDVFLSNPAAADDDPIASAYQKRQLKSQLSVRYFNDNVQEATMDNYSDCIEEGNFEAEIRDSGVKITYTLGEAAKKYILPEVISVERLEGFAGQLDKSESKKLLRNYTKYELDKVKESEKKDLISQYPGIEAHSIYVLKSGAKEYVKEELAGYLKSIGYSQDDYDFDLQDNGFESENKKPWFKIPLEYSLTGDKLQVTVDPSAIEYNEEGYNLVEVDVLPYFGAAVKGSEGYIFVPDGSGALIAYDRITDTSYTAPVYGQDVTMNVLAQSKSQADQSLAVKLPVFGQKTGDKAYYAVIARGDAYATLNASTSGRINNYNNVYAGFMFLEYGESSLGNVVGSNSFQMYSENRFKQKEGEEKTSSVYAIDYHFLSGDKADYSGMAEGYRNEWIAPLSSGNETAEDSIPFYVEYIGAIDKDATFLGIKYRSVTPVTTYAQAAEITGSLVNAGIDNVSVIYSGWANKGLHGYSYTSVKPVSKLNKGGMNQKKFMTDLAGKGIDVFYTAELQRVYRDGLFDKYAPLGSAPKYFDRSTVREATYYLSNNMVDKNDYINLLRPTLAAEAADKVLKKISKYDNAGVNLGTISWQLYTDQQSERYTDRQDASLCNSEAAGKFAGLDNKVMADNANYYMAVGASDIINAPADSNRSLIITDVVPFYEMVMHGYKDYALDCLNMTDDYNTTLLKSIESGAGLYFKWIYADNSVLKETKFDQLYSVNYESWLDKAIEDYKKVNDILGPLQGQTITKHEFIENDVVAVTYEKGTKIVVNYSDRAITAEGQTVEPHSYGVIK
ncbi:MAG: hypothetical protein K6E19_06015 [Lachnospiraceae bacterium]|nr:hypothetical protein [Lachnospiraceae bacterium]